ncbi:MAG: hypothetical protein S4CHLAM123_00930 [Chlamydiales bacterium]|nr:hypothetical protein [Chlamydiales bacterium]
MSCPAPLERALFKAQGCIYDTQSLSNAQKATLVTTIALTTITLLTLALLGHFNVIHGLNSIAQQGMFSGAAILFAASLIFLTAYQCRKMKNPFPNGREAHLGSFTDGTSPEVKKIKTYITHLQLRERQALNRGQAAEYLFRFLDDPNKLLIANTCLFGGHTVNLFPRLQECSCCNSGNFNRFHNTRRQDLESKMVSDVAEHFPAETTNQIRYLGFGVGGLLQDYINVGKLMRAGYRQIDVVLVDPEFRGDVDQSKQESRNQFRFLEHAAQELEISLTISYHSSVNELGGAFHIISAIDFDHFMKAAFSDAVQVQNRLVEGGRYYLAFDVHDLIFNHAGLVENRMYTELPNAANALFESLRATQYASSQVHVVLVEDEVHIMQWVYCLRALTQERDLEKIVITLPVPRKRNYFGAPTEELEPAMNQESLNNFFKLLMPTIEVEIRLFQTFEQLQVISQPSDVILWLSGQNVQSQIQPQIKWMKRNHPQAVHYYECAAYEDANPGKCVWRGAWRWSARSSIQFFTPDDHDAISAVMSE